MSERASTTDQAGESRASTEDREHGARSAGRGTDGMRIEIGGVRDGYIEVSAGRTIAALVAVVGAIAIVAILANPRLLAAATGESDSGGGRVPDRTDGAREDESGEQSRRQSPSGDLEG